MPKPKRKDMSLYTNDNIIMSLDIVAENKLITRTILFSQLWMTLYWKKCSPGTAQIYHIKYKLYQGNYWDSSYGMSTQGISCCTMLGHMHASVNNRVQNEKEYNASYIKLILQIHWCCLLHKDI